MELSRHGLIGDRVILVLTGGATGIVLFNLGFPIVLVNFKGQLGSDIHGLAYGITIANLAYLLPDDYLWALYGTREESRLCTGTLVDVLVLAGKDLSRSDFFDRDEVNAFALTLLPRC